MRQSGLRLPWRTPLPESSAARRRARVLRVAAYVVLSAALIVPVVQFQLLVARQAGEDSSAAEAGALRGAINRWRPAIRAYWAGENIYLPVPGPGAGPEDRNASGTYLHPNMPLTVVFLSPFAYMPPLTATLLYNLLKAAVAVASLLMLAEVVRHGERRVPDWVVALGFLFGVRFIIGDIQHGNTNVFVLGGVACHLWLYRRGRDLLAGLPLAAAICLKLTPALFVLYWLHQRNWKLAGATLAALVLLAVVVPVVASGPARYFERAGTWLDSLILPAVVENQWYPEHINQSLPGMAARLFRDGRDGDIYWSPDSDPHYRKGPRDWITLVSLPERAVQMIVRAGQLIVLGLMAWAIGRRRLARDDGRRSLHYAMIVLAMMLLNQRTWDHHATVVLVAGVALWHAVGYGRMSTAARKLALGLALAAGALTWCIGNDLFKVAADIAGRPEEVGDLWADLFSAYGSTFWVFVLLFAACVICGVATRRHEPPYAPERQKLDTRPE